MHLIQMQTTHIKASPLKNDLILTLMCDLDLDV